MAKHTTHKASNKGKAATLAKREARAAKYAPAEGVTLTRAGHVRKEVRG